MTMKKIGFDSQKYIELQSARIRERIDQFGGKLYLEFGGKLFVVLGVACVIILTVAMMVIPGTA